MNKNELERLLKGVADGSVAVDDALSKIKATPYTDLGFAKIDNHR